MIDKWILTILWNGIYISNIVFLLIQNRKLFKLLKTYLEAITESNKKRLCAESRLTGVCPNCCEKCAWNVEEKNEQK